jgi:hypothetical protein
MTCKTFITQSAVLKANPCIIRENRGKKELVEGERIGEGEMQSRIYEQGKTISDFRFRTWFSNR